MGAVSSWCFLFVGGVLTSLAVSGDDELKVAATCNDLRDDCARFVGRGPLGGGCEKHANYMKVVCARTCGFCGEDSKTPDLRAFVLPGYGPVSAISWRGVRAWHFFELDVPIAAAPRLHCDEPGHDETLVSGLSCSAAAAVATAQKRTHVAMAHFYDGASHTLNSSIYRWDPTFWKFIEHQRLPTVGAWDLATLDLNGITYLAIASFHDGASRHLSSGVYRWSLASDGFELHQEVMTVGAMDVEALRVDESSALLVFCGSLEVNRGVGSGSCQLLRWDGFFFEEFQSLDTTGTFDSEAFLVKDGADDLEVLLVVVHEQRTDVYVGPVIALRPGHPSRFDLVQSLDVAHGRDAEHFVSGAGKHSVVIAVFRDDRSYSTHSLLYKWDSEARSLREVQKLASMGAFDCEMIGQVNTTGDESHLEPILLLASQRGESQLFRVDSGLALDSFFGAEHEHEPVKGLWTKFGTLALPNVYDVAWHRVREAQGSPYLGIASFWD